MVIRFLMGAAESTTYPALLIMTSMWYTSQEHSMRSMVWSTANAGMGVFTSLINYAIGSRAEREGSLAAWKGISFFLGPLTIALAAVMYGTLGTPREVRWLSAPEKRMAHARMVASQTGSDAQKRAWDWRQVWVAFRDPQTYFFFFVSVIDGIPNGGLGAFGSLVYLSFGFSPLEVIVKGTIPQNLLSIVWFLIVGGFTLKKPGLRCESSGSITHGSPDRNLLSEHGPQGWLTGAGIPNAVYFMLGSLVPNFAGLFALGFLPKEQDDLLWTRWGCYFITSLGYVVGPRKCTIQSSHPSLLVQEAGLVPSRGRRKKAK